MYVCWTRRGTDHAGEKQKKIGEGTFANVYKGMSLDSVSVVRADQQESRRLLDVKVRQLWLLQTRADQ